MLTVLRKGWVGCWSPNDELVHNNVCLWCVQNIWNTHTAWRSLSIGTDDDDDDDDDDDYDDDDDDDDDDDVDHDDDNDDDDDDDDDDAYFQHAL